MEVTYIGHAAMIMKSSGGKTILMDPWLTDPTYHGTWWHYPQLALGVDDLPPIDYLYISHEHPDHFDPPTLERMDKRVSIVIANFRNKKFRDRIAALGFDDITELDFHEDYQPTGADFTLRMIAPDRAWDDSAIVVRDAQHTFVNVNDCHLDDQTLAKLGESFDIDLSFLTFTGASQYPNCFDFPEQSRLERARASKKSHIEEFVSWAKLLRTKRAVPAAGNFALLAEDQLHLNDPNYVNHPGEAIAALKKEAPEIEGVQMNPGDRWSEGGGLERLNPAPDWDRRMEEIHRLSSEVQPRVRELRAAEVAASPGLAERFRTHFNTILARDPKNAREIGITVWWQVDGPEGGDWYIDFNRDDDWVQSGVPDDWNLRITMPDKLVEMGVSGHSSWDNLVLSFRSRLSRQPDDYKQAFWTWFCKL